MQWNGFIFISLIKNFRFNTTEYFKIYFDCCYSLQCNDFMIFQYVFITMDLFHVLLTAWKGNELNEISFNHFFAFTIFCTKYWLNILTFLQHNLNICLTIFFHFIEISVLLLVYLKFLVLFFRKKVDKDNCYKDESDGLIARCRTCLKKI